MYSRTGTSYCCQNPSSPENEIICAGKQITYYEVILFRKHKIPFSLIPVRRKVASCPPPVRVQLASAVISLVGRPRDVVAKTLGALTTRPVLSIQVRERTSPANSVTIGKHCFWTAKNLAL